MPLQVVADPRDPGLTQADYDEQFRVSMEVADSSAAVGGGYGPGLAEGRPTLGSLQKQRDLDQTWADVSQRLRVLLDQRWPEIKPPS